MALAVLMFSMAGIPPMAGFLGKFYLVQRALSTGPTALAVIVMLNAAIAAAYYLRIVTAMYLREALFPFTVRNVLAIRLSAVLCTLAVLAFFIFPGVLTRQNQIFEKSAPLTRAPAAFEMAGESSPPHTPSLSAVHN